MIKTGFKPQLPFTSPGVSACSTVDLHGWDAERVPAAECMQFIPRDPKEGAVLSVQRIVEMPMVPQNHIEKSKRAEEVIRPGDWRVLAKRVSREMDPDKLIILVEELDRALEESQRLHSRPLE